MTGRGAGGPSPSGDVPAGKSAAGRTASDKDAAKLVGVDDAARHVQACRERGETVVFTCGCFDVLHVGHVRSLRAARSLGDHLMIGLNTDASVRALKGEGRPLFPAEERAEVLAALEAVDWIVLVPDLTMDRVLDRVRPHLYAKGTDYTLETIPERDTVRAYGGKLAIVGDPKTRSSRQFRLQRRDVPRESSE
jgi:rfaE bifunctional protein nucleotidyltransferase chain/domain